MNDPIDILEIAEQRYASALLGLRRVTELDATCRTFWPAAIPTCAARLDAARDDLWRARRLSNDVTLLPPEV